MMLLVCLLLSSCAAQGQVDSPAPTRALPTPTLPTRLTLNDDGVPLLDVYVVDKGETRSMSVETYVQGVVAGEMKNDWPVEALKAQAILARTFVMRFVAEKESRYEGADISTDIAEAQAYDATAVNDHVRQAVKETEGLVLATQDGQLPYTWFHAHSGGRTALAQEALGWTKAEPAYTLVTEGLDSPDAPKEAKCWQAEFTKEEFLAACSRAGLPLAKVENLRIGETGPSGRAVTLLADGEAVNAARLRLELGSTEMRSTLLTEVGMEGNRIRMAGLGYGHGVGMPQWGAYALAQDGLTGEDIALHYYMDLRIVKMW